MRKYYRGRNVNIYFPGSHILTVDNKAEKTEPLAHDRDGIRTREKRENSWGNEIKYILFLLRVVYTFIFKYTTNEIEITS